MNHIEVLMEYKYMQKSLTQALTTLSWIFCIQNLIHIDIPCGLLVKWQC